MEFSDETWLPVPGFESLYSVSSRGRIRREACVRLNGGRETRHAAKLRKPHTNLEGYLCVCLYPLVGGKKSFRVSVLVLTAFVGPRPVGLECAHGDGNKQNNQLSNLRWATKEENAADRKLHGTNAEGERSGRAILKAEQVRAIRSDKRTQRAIAADYGVAHTTIHAIKSGVNWASLE
jgi:hypothetical protein